MNKILQIDERFCEQEITHIIRMKCERNFEIDDLSVGTVNHYHLPEGSLIAIEAVEIDAATASKPAQWWINLNFHDSCNLEEGVDFEVIFVMPDKQNCRLLLPRQYAFEDYSKPLVWISDEGH